MKLRALLSIGVVLLSTGSLASAQTKSVLKFDRIKYPPGGCLQIAVDDADENRSASIPDSVSVRIASSFPATSSGDQETLTLGETGPSTGRFVLPSCLPVVVGAGIPDDGMFRVHAGDMIVAVYEDPDNPPSDPQLLDAAADTALVSGGTPTGAFQYSIDPTILPEDLGSTPGVTPTEPPRPLAMVVGPGNVPHIFGEDQLILRSARASEPADFLAERNGTLVEQVTVDRDDPTPGAGRVYHVVRVDPTQQDLADFAYVMETLGASGSWVFSSDAAVRLMAMLFEEQLGGRFVMPNRLLLPHGLPATIDGDCDGDGIAGDNGLTCDATWMPMSVIGLDRAILYMDLIDANQAGSVGLAVIDGGFAGPADFPLGVGNPDFGPVFAEISQGDCDAECDGSAAGPNPTRCAGGAGGLCDWHGTLSFSVAAAVAGNAFGAVGVAGHARGENGLPGSRGIVDPILLKVGYPYVTGVARAVEEAVSRGADIVNISSGGPCAPFEINVCDAGTRVVAGITCFLITSVLDPGFVCVELIDALADAGFTDLDVLEAATQDAIEAGTLVVAAGPEDVDLGPLGDMGPFDAVEENWIPCNLPGVLCVGALNANLAPAGFNPIGSGIDIWAPGVNLATTPVPGSGGANTQFSGTSAAAPFLAGTAALLKAIDPGLTPDQMRDILQGTSVALPGGDPDGDCIPHPNGVDPCVGTVDVLTAVEQAGGVTLTCSGLEGDANDTRDTATPVDLVGQGVFEVDEPVGVHAMALDEDWYSFSVPDLGAPSTEVRITLHVADPDYGTLVMELSRDADVIATVEAIAGLAEFHAYFDVGSSYYVRITAAIPAATNDNCYGGTITFWVAGPGPSADPLEGAGGNNSANTATDLTNTAWIHEHLDEAILGDQFTLVNHTEDSWTKTISGLSLHTLTDVDYFRVPLPDPGDGAAWPGHGDIDPDLLSVVPMPECDVVQRTGLFGETENVIFTGFLTIRILPILAPGDDELRIVDPVLAQAAFGGAWTKTIACPRGTLAALGLSDVLFSFGDRAGLGVRDLIVGYDLVLDYTIDVQRVPADESGGGGGSDEEDPPTPLPCLGDFFPNCVGGGEGWDLEHPFDFDLPCFMDGCEDTFLFDWVSESPMELLFTSTVDLTFELHDLLGGRLASALPMAPMSSFPESALVGTVTKRLFVPLLPRGQYLLVVRGPAAAYRIVFPVRDTDADGLPDHEDNCASVWNPSQADGDQDRIGDACDCSPTDPTIGSIPAEVSGPIVRRSMSGPDSTDLSWMPLAYQAGPATVYDVISGLLSALQADSGGAYSSLECLADDVPMRGIVLPDDRPPANDGFWYLVRAENPCGSGTWGDGTPVPDPRDVLDPLECVPAMPVLSISKTASPDPVAAGGEITYALHFQNAGDAAATSVVVSDTIPANTTFVSASGGGSPDPSQVVHWNLGTVPAGSSGVLELVVRVTSPLPTGTVITNDAYSIDSAETAPVGGSPVTTTVVSAPALSISKTDSPDPVPAGGTITYTLNYQNSGNATATSVVVSDTIPANTTFVSASGGGTPDPSEVVHWNLGTVPAGSAGMLQLVVRVTSPLPTGTVITNDAYSIDSAETAPATGGPVTTTVVSSPVLSISKTDSPDPVPTGGTITYTIAFQNTGNADATSVVVSDTIPASTAFVSATGGGSPDPAGVVRWNLGTVPAGTSGSVQMTVRVVSLTVTTITNGTYSIDSSETAPTSGAPVTTTVLPPPIVAIDLDPSTPLVIDSARTIPVSASTLDVGVIVNASGTAGIGDIARIAFGVINAFNTGGATVAGIATQSIVDLMPPATSPNNATFAALAGEFQLGAVLIERGVPGNSYAGGAVQFARFRITFGTRTVGSTVRVFIGDAGPGHAAVRAASGADISGDATADDTPVGGVAGADQGAGAGMSYRDAVVTFQ